jgi:stage V sporulation protein B
VCRMKVGMGRGTLYLMAANGIFLVSGYIIHFGLGRYLGPEAYGLFGVVLYLMTTVNLFLTSGFPQSASKYIAEDNARLGSIMSHSFKIQGLLSLVIFAVYLGLAGVIANLLNDADLVPYIRISAFVIPAYAIFSIYSAGYLNGLRQFGMQAKTLIGTSIAKIVGVIALVWVGLSVNGAILGYLFGVLIGLLLAWKYLRPIERGNKDFEWAKLIKFGIPATLFAVMLLLLMSIDLFAVKAITVGDIDAGLYTSATTIARLPYFLFAGLALTLLPSISRSTAIGDVKLTSTYISQSLRYMLILLIPGILIISATSAGLITLVYSSRYIEAAQPLSVLVFGLGLIAVFNVLCNMIIGSGKPSLALGIAFPLVLIDIALNIALIPRYGLLGAAIATTVTGFIGMVAAAAYVLWRFKTLVPAKSLLKICVASAVIYAIAINISLSPFLLPLLYIGLFTLYLGLLVVMKELKKEDAETFKRIIPLQGFM